MSLLVEGVILFLLATWTAVLTYFTLELIGSSITSLQINPAFAVGAWCVLTLFRYRRGTKFRYCLVK